MWEMRLVRNVWFDCHAISANDLVLVYSELEWIREETVVLQLTLMSRN